MLTSRLLARRGVLVVGGGRVAERKVKSLLALGAKVRLVSSVISTELKRLANETGSTLQLEERLWREGEITDEVLVFAATDSREVNQQVARQARTAGCLVNLADDPAACDFTVPGTIHRAGLTLAIATGSYRAEPGDSPSSGLVSPALTAHLRRRLEVLIGPEYDVLARVLRRLRPDVKASVPPQQRRDLWQNLINAALAKDSPVLVQLQNGGELEATTLLKKWMQEELWKS